MGEKSSDQTDGRTKSESFFSIVFLLLSLASFVGIFFIPDFQRNEIYASAIDLSEYTLNDVVHPSLYRGTARSGDTVPSLPALFHAVSILQQSKGKLSDEKRVKAYLSSLEPQLDDTEEIYHFLSVASFLKSLTPSSADKYYQQLLSLIEPASGFRASSSSPSASVTATYQALESISFLGKIDTFKASTRFDSVLRFVRSSNTKHGYSDTYKAEPTLSATHYAHKILAKYDTAVQEGDVEGVVDFVLSCQSADGGFLEHSLHSNQERFYILGSLETTTRAVETILSLHPTDLHSLLLPLTDFGVYHAISFIRSCVSVDSIKSRSTDYYGSISATDALVTLVNAYHQINFETPRSFQVGLFGAGLFFLSLALYYTYRSRLVRVKGFDAHHVVSGTAILLLVTAAVLKASPNFSVVPLVFLTGFLLKVFYQNLEDLFRTGEDTVLALALGGSSIYGLFIFGLIYFSPLAFTSMSIYYVLVCWSAVGVFGAVVIAKQFLLATKTQGFYYSGATMSWIANTLILYSVLYSRGLVTLVHHLVTVSGNFFSFYVALPISSLILIYVAVNIALSLTSFTPLVPPKKK